MALRFEAWTLPWSTTFQRTIAQLPVIEGTGRGSSRFNDDGEGSLALKSDYVRLDELVSDTAGSLIRVYDGSTLIHEWVAERVSHDVEDGAVVVSGQELVGYAFQRAIVYPYDYPLNPSIQPDWSWGSGRNLVDNAGFETATFPNAGFELGNTDYWSTTDDNGTFEAPTGFTVVNDSGVAQAGDWYGSFNPTGAYSGLERTFGNLIPGETYTITGYLREPAASGLTYRLGVAGATNGAHTNSYRQDGIIWADLGNTAKDASSSTNAWQQTTLTFDAVGDQIQLFVVYSDSGNGPVTYADSFTISGPGVGLDGWSEAGTVGTMDVSAVQAHSGSQSMRVRVTDFLNTYLNYANSGVDYQIGLTPGKTYTASVWIYHASGSDERFSLRIRRNGRVGGEVEHGFGSYQLARVSADVPTATWTQLEVTFVADFQDMFLGVRWRDTPQAAAQSPIFYIDDVSVTEGLPVATVGEIVGALMDDAAVDHASDTRGAVLDWVDYTGFSDTQDSSSDNWDADIAFLAHRGMTYLQVLQDLVALGYEYRLTPKATPGATTHDLEIYNPDNMDAAPEVGLITGQMIGGGSVVKRVPDYTAAFVEGAGQQFDEAADSTAVTNFGRSEKYRAFRELGDTTSLASASGELLGDESDNRTAVHAKLHGHRYRPLADFTIGDTITFQLPGLVTADRRVHTVAYKNANPTEYDVTGSRVFPGVTGGWEAVRKLIRRFQAIDEPSRARVVAGGSGGGAPSVVVAASDATELSKAKADFICEGSDDQEVIQAAVDSLAGPGRVLLTEGNFSITVPSGGPAVTLGSYQHLIGMGNEASYLLDDTASDPGSGSAMVQTASRNVISDLAFSPSFDNSKAVRVPSQNGLLWVDRCYFDSSGAEAIFTADRPTLIWATNNFFVSSGSLPLISMGSIRWTWIVGNRFSGGSNSVRIVDDAAGGFVPAWITIANNVSDLAEAEAFYVDGGRSIPSYTYIEGNTVQSAGNGYASQQATAAIRVLGDSSATNDVTDTDSGEPQVKIINNQVEGVQFSGGIRLDYVHQADIHSNQVENTQGAGIALVDTSGADVSGNRVIWVLTDDDTFDAISVSGDSDFNYVHTNTIVNDVAASLAWRYGVNIVDSTCNSNIVVGNRGIGSFGTGGLNDSGTGTSTTWPSL